MTTKKHKEQNNPFIQVITTTDKRETAASLANLAVEARLAACAQISGPITSTYIWNDKLETEDEWNCSFKTTLQHYNSLEKMILENHPYDTPQIIALPVITGSTPYLSWIEKNTSSD